MLSGVTRRHFLRTGGAATLAALSIPRLSWAKEANSPPFRISLAEWSLHRTIRSGKITNLDFPVVARKEFGIEAIEYVNSFFKSKARDETYLGELKDRCDSEGVRSLVIMCDGEGRLGDPDDAARSKAVENHHRWVEAARFPGLPLDPSQRLVLWELPGAAEACSGRPIQARRVCRHACYQCPGREPWWAQLQRCLARRDHEASGKAKR